MLCCCCVIIIIWNKLCEWLNQQALIALCQEFFVLLFFVLMRISLNRIQFSIGYTSGFNDIFSKPLLIYCSISNQVDLADLIDFQMTVTIKSVISFGIEFIMNIFTKNVYYVIYDIIVRKTFFFSLDFAVFMNQLSVWNISPTKI